MAWIIGILTFVLVVDCLLLALLVLMQLPKKEAGLGQAFGGGATDALFGAGTGNVLTKLTKYTAGIFFCLTLTLSVLNAHQAKAKQGRFGREVGAVPLQTPPSTLTNAAAAAATEATNQAPPADPAETPPPGEAPGPSTPPPTAEPPANPNP